jgi:hypothetical protein
MKMIVWTGKWPVRLLLVFVSGFALGVATLVFLRDSVRPPDKPLGEVPRHRENVLVMKWLLDYRPDADHIRFMQWWPPLPLRDNPFTHRPATLVHVVLTNDAPGDRGVEDLLFYVSDDQVLGAIPNGRGETDPRAPLRSVQAPPFPPGPPRPPGVAYPGAGKRGQGMPAGPAPGATTGRAETPDGS